MLKENSKSINKIIDISYNITTLNKLELDKVEILLRGFIKDKINEMESPLKLLDIHTTSIEPGDISNYGLLIRFVFKETGGLTLKESREFSEEMRSKIDIQLESLINSGGKSFSFDFTIARYF